MLKLRKILYRQLYRGIERDGSLSKLNRFLVLTIILAVFAAVLSTEQTIPSNWHKALVISEMVFGFIFFLEYIARIFASAQTLGPGSDWQKRWAFIISPMGIIDLLVVISALVPFITADVAMLRTVRLFRVIALMKFGRFNHALSELWKAIADRKDDFIVVFALSWIVLLFGATALYMLEGHIQPEKFGSIPRALWWSVITFTAVGYGDVVPITVAGKIVAIFMIFSGICLIAMPTGIIAAAFSDAMQKRRDKQIELMQRHIEEQDEVDKQLAAQLAAIEKKRGKK